MRPMEDIRKRIKEVPLDTNSERDEEVLADVLNALEESRMTQSAAHRPGIWRLIMKNNVTRVAAAVVILAVLVGVYQFDGARAAFAQTTQVVRTGLAGLRQFILDIRSGKLEQPAHAPSAESSEPKPAAQGNRIFAGVQVFSVQPGQRDLQEFLKGEIELVVPAGNGVNTSYTKLGPQKTERLLALIADSEGIKRLSSPSLMVLEGQQGMIGILEDGKPDALGLAFVATVLDDGVIELSLSFLHGEDGFEVPNLRVGADEAVLFSLSTAAPAQEKQNGQDEPAGITNILVLLRTKVFPQS